MSSDTWWGLFIGNLRDNRSGAHARFSYELHEQVNVDMDSIQATPRRPPCGQV